MEKDETNFSTMKMGVFPVLRQVTKVAKEKKDLKNRKIKSDNGREFIYGNMCNSELLTFVCSKYEEI